MDWNIPISEEQKSTPGHHRAGGHWALPSPLPHWTEAIWWPFCPSHLPASHGSMLQVGLLTGSCFTSPLVYLLWSDSARSHSYPGLCLTTLKLDYMLCFVIYCYVIYCTCSPLYLRWAVALRLGLAREFCRSWNNTHAIQSSPKSVGILQLTHTTRSSAALLNQFPQTSTHTCVYISTYK